MERKKIIVIAGIIFILFFLIGIIFASKWDEKEVKIDEEVITDSSYSWPNLEEYDIPNLEKGKISELNNKSNKDGYQLNYTISISDITQKEIDEYVKKFDSKWTISRDDNEIIMVTANRTTKYSISIVIDESNSSAKIIISSI